MQRCEGVVLLLDDQATPFLRIWCCFMAEPNHVTVAMDHRDCFNKASNISEYMQYYSEIVVKIVNTSIKQSIANTIAIGKMVGDVRGLVWISYIMLHCHCIPWVRRLLRQVPGNPLMGISDSRVEVLPAVPQANQLKRAPAEHQKVPVGLRP